MSYCRWSCDSFKSDVYVYEHVDGTWTTHVAANKRLDLDTLPPDPYSILTSKEYNKRTWPRLYREYYKRLEKLPIVPIELPHAGETFKDASPGECAKTLKMLRDVGYHVPDGVIEELRREQNQWSAL